MGKVKIIWSFIVSLFDRSEIPLPLQAIAKSAYEAYGYYREWKDWRGGPMPKWDDLNEGIQRAWMVASQQAIDVASGESYGNGIESKWTGWKP